MLGFFFVLRFVQKLSITLGGFMQSHEIKAIYLQCKSFNPFKQQNNKTMNKFKFSPNKNYIYLYINNTKLKYTIFFLTPPSLQKTSSSLKINNITYYLV